MERDNEESRDEGGQQKSNTQHSGLLADDAFYRALADQKRRRLLYYLTGHDRSTVDDLADVLVGWQSTEQQSMASPEQFEETRMTLEHVHLPMLADAGLVAYDEDEQRVALERRDEQVEELLEKSIEAEHT